MANADDKGSFEKLKGALTATVLLLASCAIIATAQVLIIHDS